MLGFVPEYDCREAAVYVGIPWPQWVELDMRERASVVAHHRVHMLLEAHVNDAASRKSERDSRRAGASRRGRG